MSIYLMRVNVRDNPTVDGFALRQVAVILASEEAVPISAYNPLDISKIPQQPEYSDSMLPQRCLPAVHIEK